MTETTTHPSAASLLDRHRARLDAAVAACASREYYSAFDESPSPRVYGETAAAEGKAAFEARLGTAFPLETPGAAGTVATERSPYGFDLGVSYPRAVDVDALMAAARAGMRAWRDAGPDGRTGVCLEILDRLHARIFELAGAVQHTSGQAFVMAFQAGGAHALDRALEALAYAWTEMTRTPATAIWEKPGRGGPLRMEKTFTVVPRGVALVIGCNTFPTWNSWPGLFASLVTGNPVVVKPHPAAVLPLAITVHVVDSTSDFAAMCQNLAFSFALYSGQMCTAPQNVYVPAAGVATEDGVRSPAEVGAGIGAALDRLLGDDARAVELLGGIVNEPVVRRLEAAGRHGAVLVASRTVRHPTYDDATVRTPTIVGLTAADADVYESECFGPVAYLIGTSGTDESVALFRDTVQRHGAMTAAVYSTSPEVVDQVREAALDAGVALSENLLGGVFVNQSAAFSDFHGTGANPAANAAYTDGAYVASRFRVVQSRRHI